MSLIIVILGTALFIYVRKDRISKANPPAHGHAQYNPESAQDVART